MFTSNLPSSNPNCSVGPPCYGSNLDSQQTNVLSVGCWMGVRSFRRPATERSPPVDEDNLEQSWLYWKIISVSRKSLATPPVEPMPNWGLDTTSVACDVAIADWWRKIGWEALGKFRLLAIAVQNEPGEQSLKAAFNIKAEDWRFISSFVQIVDAIAIICKGSRQVGQVL